MSQRSRTWWYPVCAAIVVLFAVCETGRAQSTHEAVDYVQPRMVKIFGAGGLRNLRAYSTGFLVTRQGHIATIWSHVLDSDDVTVVLNDGRRFRARVLGAEPQIDLSVLKIQTDDKLDLPYFDVDKAASVGPGTRILGFSNMFKVATGDEAVSVLQGVIAAKTKLPFRRGSFQSPYPCEVYIVDAITNNAGGEGGVVTTRSGKLIGMIGKELRNAQSNTWVNYCIPITELSELIKQIISGRFDAKPLSSATVENPNRFQSLDFGLVLVPDVVFRTPAYIDSIIAGSDAAKAGLRPDDLILFVDDELIQSCKMLTARFGRLEIGDVLRLVVRRGNELVTVEIKVKKKDH